MNTQCEQLSLHCEEVEALLPRLLENTLEDDIAEEIFAHIAGCQSCQESLASYDLIDLALGATPTSTQKPQHLRYAIPLHWGLAAGLIIGLGLTAVWTATRSQPSSPIAEEQRSEAFEILQILPPGPGREQAVFVVRDQGQIRLLSGEDIDGGEEEGRSPLTHPVTHGRPIRHLGAVD